jgi:hypothetical protein
MNSTKGGAIHLLAGKDWLCRRVSPWLNAGFASPPSRSGLFPFPFFGDVSWGIGAFSRRGRPHVKTIVPNGLPSILAIVPFLGPLKQSFTAAKSIRR